MAAEFQALFWVIQDQNGDLVPGIHGSPGSPKLYQSEGRARMWASGRGRKVIRVRLVEEPEYV